MIKEFKVGLPAQDCDVALTFPNGKTINIKCRENHKDPHYNGMIEIILPDNRDVLLQKSSCEVAPKTKGQASTYLTNRIVMELLYNPEDPTDPNAK